MQMFSKALVLLSLASTPSVAIVSEPAKGLRAALHPADDSMVKPIKFDQQFIVCNAYPSHSLVTLTRNGGEALASGQNALRFRECRRFDTPIQAHDKLDLTLSGIEIHGTFEVGALPASDAVLLLVLQRRDHSKLLSFQSFAFPTGAETKEAQLAVVDAYKGNHSSRAHLKVEDHVNNKEAHEVSKRVEELNFNHVYSVEEGAYDASVSDQKAKKLLNLVKSQDYVVLRTGEDGNFPESLVVFPEVVHSDSTNLRRAALTIVFAAFFTAFMSLP
mmetsp:Transcript_89185/g.177309  ORF Transcript_89185/g.177309 Transcript_89185/m.177309 type:complete len:274 (-) Transcript_89185:49-870(-)|eukprot:CAMPEP_0172726512 /NCGR_PEP_ID=MMETSP1074-20121228/90906_1 /TAXON_ID=2916 /ORGANISM="Ceratium fusus, Strain PA161109" /LENGTH=273 /DNA_ID=CAMNT_0013553563 /DNA_START=73 /DNA_END=894 /DNA_ORIENTATION=+